MRGMASWERKVLGRTTMAEEGAGMLLVDACRGPCYHRPEGAMLGEVGAAASPCSAAGNQ